MIDFFYQIAVQLRLLGSQERLLFKSQVVSVFIEKEQITEFS